MLKIAVSQRVDVWPDRDERRDALDQRLAAWLWRIGCVALPTPNALDEGALASWLETTAPDGILLSGGNDVGQCLERDATETALLGHAAVNRLPVLGICRGMQMMAVHAGARLVPVAHHTRTRHRLVADTIAAPADVNSFHDWAVAECPAGYDVTCRSEGDGVIEAFRHRELPWEGWMWHPEREPADRWDHDLGRARRIFHGKDIQA